jgi:hypothetical protein
MVERVMVEEGMVVLVLVLGVEYDVLHVQLVGNVVALVLVLVVLV